MASKESKPCELRCSDKNGKERMVPAGSRFKICSTCRASIAQWSLRSSADVHSHLSTLETRLSRAKLVEQGGKDKNGKLDANTYLGQLAIKRKKRGKTRVIYG